MNREVIRFYSLEPGVGGADVASNGEKLHPLNVSCLIFFEEVSDVCHKGYEELQTWGGARTIQSASILK